jgi:hypothetical protein
VGAPSEAAVGMGGRTAVAAAEMAHPAATRRVGRLRPIRA